MAGTRAKETGKTASSQTVQKKPSRASGPKKEKGETEEKGFEEGYYNMRLYVAGQTPKSLAAFVNLKKICEEHLKGKYSIEIIDLMVNPKLAQGDQILAIPTLIRRLPEPIKRIIGDLSDAERVLVGLDIQPRDMSSEE